MSRFKIGILTSALIIFALTPFSGVRAADETPLLRSPSETLREVMEPIQDSFRNAVQLVGDVVGQAWGVISLGLDWIGEKIVFIFENIDGWLASITGFGIGETLGIIGSFFVNIFNAGLNFVREIIW